MDGEEEKPPFERCLSGEFSRDHHFMIWLDRKMVQEIARDSPTARRRCVSYEITDDEVLSLWKIIEEIVNDRR